MLCEISETCSNKKSGAKVVRSFLLYKIGPGLMRQHQPQKNTDSLLRRGRLNIALKKLLPNIIKCPKKNFPLTIGSGLVRDYLLIKYTESPLCRNRLDIYLKRILNDIFLLLEVHDFSLTAGLGFIRENLVKKNTESLLYRDRLKIKLDGFYLTNFVSYNVLIVET